MKKVLILAIFLQAAFASHAQVALNDLGRIILNTYLSEDVTLPAEAKSQLKTKLDQITSSNGIGGSQANPRFIITAKISIGTKDIVAGPPQLIAQNIDITLFIGDALSNTVYSNANISTKGVGTNENKAFIDAFKNINPKSKEISAFVEEGKTKIISYYSTQCDFIIKEANTLAAQHKYEEAIYNLMLVPETCKACYFKCKDEAADIFKKKIESDCTEKLKEGNIIWATEPNQSGAAKAAEILISIIPSDNCRVEISKLSVEIKKKLLDEEKRKYDMEMQVRKQKYDTEQKLIEAAKEVALEQAKQQPKEIIYNHIFWK